jgi:hypothetical protein
MNTTTVEEQGDGELDLSVDGIEPAETEDKETKWQERWEDSKGMLLILCSELFGTCMAAAARLLEMGDGGMMTLQVSYSLAPSVDLCWES